MRGGLTQKVERDHTIRLRFTNVGTLPPPVSPCCMTALVGVEWAFVLCLRGVSSFFCGDCPGRACGPLEHCDLVSGGVWSFLSPGPGFLIQPPLNVSDFARVFFYIILVAGVFLGASGVVLGQKFKSA